MSALTWLKVMGTLGMLKTYKKDRMGHLSILIDGAVTIYDILRLLQNFRLSHYKIFLKMSKLQCLQFFLLKITLHSLIVPFLCPNPSSTPITHFWTFPFHQNPVSCWPSTLYPLFHIPCSQCIPKIHYCGFFSTNLSDFSIKQTAAQKSERMNHFSSPRSRAFAEKKFVCFCVLFFSFLVFALESRTAKSIIELASWWMKIKLRVS